MPGSAHFLHLLIGKCQNSIFKIFLVFSPWNYGMYAHEIDFLGGLIESLTLSYQFDIVGDHSNSLFYSFIKDI